MEKLTERQEEILLSLIRKEIINMELAVGGAIDIMSNSAYLAELLALRTILRNKE